MIQEVEAVFWIDSSIRPRNTNITRWTEVFDVARKSGIVLFDDTGRAVFYYTHPQMFDYLPANVNKLEEIDMLGACVFIIYRTKSPSVTQVDNYVNTLKFVFVEAAKLAKVIHKNVFKPKKYWPRARDTKIFWWRLLTCNGVECRLRSLDGLCGYSDLVQSSNNTETLYKSMNEELQIAYLIGMAYQAQHLPGSAHS
ncbi:hypothetical protein LSH36_2067g00003 [Paralvinella palmiformis]|uniref:Uncharacterized protein n=1 Tax=Paralvinella palmiformis TaxID=53620 RepID=A0AAD9IR66_9ANNE|nr:hypothetical protein LSH36_2067g00003 [Paralvinella palmiformis]